MTQVLPPRVILVRRETELERVRNIYSTLQQARFALSRKAIDIADVEKGQSVMEAAIKRVRDAIPPDFRQGMVRRADLERFVFGPDDIIVTVGQDGLVANVAKYLDGQTVIGVDPEPGRNPGVLARFTPDRFAAALRAAVAGRAAIEERTMAEARFDGGTALLALNEIFVGHASHQSARYRISVGDASERQSSSGMIVSTGTGATGWARSIMLASGRQIDLAPTEPALAYFVREAWPGPSLGVSLTAGAIERDARVTVTSEMDDGGTIFADGIETDRLVFGWGKIVEIGVSERRLRLAVGV